jgi:hypothetical protein
MKLSGLKTNAAALAGGVWQRDIVGMGNIEFLVRGTNNPDYRRRMQAMIRALPASKRKGGTVDVVEMDRITGVCLLDHALLDWKNVEDEAGKPIPYSKDQAELYLTDPDYSPFRDGVFIAATSADNEASEGEETTAKN